MPRSSGCWPSRIRVVGLWSLRLSEFTYTVEHKAGKKHTNADALSRAVCAVKRGEALPVIDLDLLRQHQNRDAHCQDLRKGKNFKMSPEKILYRQSGGQKKIVVPEALANEVIRLHHDLPTAGHAGVAKTLERVKVKFWWKHMDKDVLDYVRTCRSCSQRNDYGKAKAPLGSLFNEPKVPFEVIAADLVGPLPISESKSRYILSVMDHLTRYCEFIPLPDQTAEEVARALVQRVITKFGVPKALLTDQGANFTSDLMKQLCRFLHVRKLQTSAFHPSSNGRLERVHSTICRMLSHFVNKQQTDWDEYLPYITMAYNSQVHESTGYSPYEMLFGRRMETPFEGDLTITDSTEIYDDHVESLRAKLKATRELAAQRSEVARRRHERQYNKKTKQVTFEVGQYVLLHVPSIKRHRVNKLSKLWKGPYQIVRVLSPLNVMLRIRKRLVVVHVNRIKPCLTRVPKPTQQLAEPEGEDIVVEKTHSGVEGLDRGVTGDDAPPTQVTAPADEGKVGLPTRPTRLGREAKRPKYLNDYV